MIDVAKLQSDAECLGKSKQERCTKRTNGCPPTKDHDCQGDKAPSCGHSLLKTSNTLQYKEGAAETCQYTSQDHIDITGTIYINADRICCPGAHQPTASANPRVYEKLHIVKR